MYIDSEYIPEIVNVSTPFLFLQDIKSVHCGYRSRIHFCGWSNWSGEKILLIHIICFPAFFEWVVMW